MGCDIHYVVEKKFEGKFVGLYGTDIVRDFKAKDRNYKFFSALASVRGNSDREPKGLPDGLSDLARMELEHWDGDAHSKSWDTMKDFCEIFYNNQHPFETEENKARKEFMFYDVLGIDQDDYENKKWADDYRVIYWFDN